MKHVIIGLGEIGEGLRKCLVNTGCIADGVDIAKNINTAEQIPDFYDVLHICIPGTLPDFVKIVTNYMDYFKPKLTVINSTVQIGMTRIIAHESENFNICHSPVRGRHPDLAHGILYYYKHFGLMNPDQEPIVSEICEDIGTRGVIHLKPEETEAGKLLELVRYGITLTLADLQKQFLDEYNLDYYNTVTAFVKTYRRGLEAGDDPKLAYPELTPPKGKIGGHCVIENSAEMLKWMPEFTCKLYDWINDMVELEKGDRQI